MGLRNVGFGAGSFAVIVVAILANIAALLGVIWIVVWFLRYLGVLAPA